MKDNKIELLEEDLECVHKYLDDLNIPRKNNRNKTYSIVGRIKKLQHKAKLEKLVCLSVMNSMMECIIKNK